MQYTIEIVIPEDPGHPQCGTWFSTTVGPFSQANAKGWMLVFASQLGMSYKIEEFGDLSRLETEGGKVLASMHQLDPPGYDNLPNVVDNIKKWLGALEDPNSPMPFDPPFWRMARPR